MVKNGVVVKELGKRHKEDAWMVSNLYNRTWKLKFINILTATDCFLLFFTNRIRGFFSLSPSIVMISEEINDILDTKSICFCLS